MRDYKGNGGVLNSDVIILGTSGMLGQEVTRIFTEEGLLHSGYSRQPGRSRYFDFNEQTAEEVAEILSVSPGAYVINCIGWIPQRGTGDPIVDQANAWKLNVNLPIVLEQLAERMSVRVLQITTDCVFDGSNGGYLESDLANAEEVYGKSKIAGEKCQPSAMQIRCSIIGQDRNSKAGLFSWYKSQPKNGFVTGYANHFWNGVTTTALAKLFLGIIRENEFVPGLQHWIPLDSVSKFELLSEFRKVLGGDAAKVLEGQGSNRVDRTLSTDNPLVSDRYWILAGYGKTPSIAELVRELDEPEQV